jgi:hypothetical protein
MSTYVQAQGRDTWHRCRNCSNYPSTAREDEKNSAKRRSVQPVQGKASGR